MNNISSVLLVIIYEFQSDTIKWCDEQQTLQLAVLYSSETIKVGQMVYWQNEVCPLAGSEPSQIHTLLFGHQLDEDSLVVR